MNDDLQGGDGQLDASNNIDYVRLAQSRMEQQSGDAGLGADGGPGQMHGKNGANASAPGSLGTAIREGNAQDWVLREMSARSVKGGLPVGLDDLREQVAALQGVIPADGGDEGLQAELERQGVRVRLQRYVDGQGWVDAGASQFTGGAQAMESDSHRPSENDAAFGSDSGFETDDRSENRRIVLDVEESSADMAEIASIGLG